MFPTTSSGATREIWAGIANWHFWTTMAWVDIRGRYRRTLLGPWWSAANSLLFVVVLATVYSMLWRVNIVDFLPFVAAGYFVWMFFSTSINESAGTFHGNAEVLRTLPLSPIALIMRLLARNLIVFGHNLVVFIVIALVFGKTIALVPVALPGLLLIAVFCGGVGTCIALLCARFRDFEQIIATIMMILFFVTPILWKEQSLPAENRYVADVNLLYHMLRVVRDPLLGTLPPAFSYLVATVGALLSIGIAVLAYRRYRPHLAYWL